MINCEPASVLSALADMLGLMNAQFAQAEPVQRLMPFRCGPCLSFPTPTASC